MSTSVKQRFPVMPDEATRKRVRDVYGEILNALGPSAPPPGVDIEVSLDAEGRVTLLTDTDAFALAPKKLVVRCRFERDGSRYVSTYKDGKRIGREVKLP